MGEYGRFLLRGEDTGGLFSFFEVTTSPGGGPPLHLHDDHDEALFVVEGRYDLRLGETTYVGEPGTLVFTPRGTPHKFRNAIDKPSRLFVIATPGGHERFFEDLSALISSGQRPAPEDFIAVATRHHVTGLEPMVVAPPNGAGARP
jgi:quercetin dioxygenase-like cupin family protein